MKPREKIRSPPPKAPPPPPKDGNKKEASRECVTSFCCWAALESSSQREVRYHIRINSGCGAGKKKPIISCSNTVKSLGKGKYCFASYILSPIKRNSPLLQGKWRALSLFFL
jgi:hypothetical protein